MNGQKWATRFERSKRRVLMFLSAIALVILGELWCVHRLHVGLRTATSRIHERQRELQRLVEVRPPPTDAAMSGIKDEVIRARQDIERMESGLTRRMRETGLTTTQNVPATRTDAYFNLAAFIEKSHAAAAVQGVTIAPAAAKFGFATYANEAPETAQIATVFRQRIVANYLVNSLLASGPRTLLAMKRAAPVTGKEHTARVIEGADYFSINSKLSVAAPGVIETCAFRVVFTGGTATLRAFLNKLDGFGRPILIRAIEVEPITAADAVADNDRDRPSDVRPQTMAASIVLSEGAGLAGASRSKVAGPTTIIARLYSRFTVTVECVDLVGQPKAGLDRNENSPAEAWKSPEPQSRGSDWTFDVFTPPEIFYHARRNEFTVTPPSERGDEATAEPFGVEVISIRAENFRLRLIGSFGHSSVWTGAFENILSGETFLAAAGGVVPAQGVEIKTIEVKRQTVGAEDAGGSMRVGTSVLRDTVSGKIVTLTEGADGLTDTLVATIGVAETDVREVRAGDEFQVGDVAYVVDDIGAAPGSVTIVKRSLNPVRTERRVLLAPLAGELDAEGYQ
jgi:hypothetical protein